jgi:hypothetical protein
MHPFRGELILGVIFGNSLICLRASKNVVGVFALFDHYSRKTT